MNKNIQAIISILFKHLKNAKIYKISISTPVIIGKVSQISSLKRYAIKKDVNNNARILINHIHAP